MSNYALAQARVENWARQPVTTGPKIQYARLLVRQAPEGPRRNLAQAALERLEAKIQVDQQ